MKITEFLSPQAVIPALAGRTKHDVLRELAESLATAYPPLNGGRVLEVLGGSFLARINMELRERRGWSYGANGSVTLLEHRTPYIIQAPVQADRTGDSIAAIMEQIHSFLSDDGVRPAELNRNIQGNTRQLSGQFETSPAVLGALRSNALYDRPDNYWETVADRYRGMTVQTLDRTARQYINPDNFVWVVVGDAAAVRPQLQRLGLPIEIVAAQ